MTGKFRLTTEHGYDFFEVASALQKCVRRDLKEEALFWAFELDSKFPDFLWKRLVTIANEDVGLADPQTVILIDALRRHYLVLIESRDRRMVITNAVVALCSARKSRLADDMTTVIYRRVFYGGWRLEIPDVALDQHTARGRAKGRGLEHWMNEGVALEHEAEGHNSYAAEANALRKKHGRGKEQGKPYVPSKKKKAPDEGELF